MKRNLSNSITVLYTSHILRDLSLGCSALHCFTATDPILSMALSPAVYKRMSHSPRPLPWTVVFDENSENLKTEFLENPFIKDMSVGL